MTTKAIKVIGILAAIIGASASLVSDWADEQKLDAKIEEKVNEKLAVQSEDEEEP